MSLMSVAAAAVAPLAGRVLIGLGFGTVTFVGLTAALNQLLDAARGALGGLVGEAGQILAMAGVFYALSIIAGALVTSVSLVALKKISLK